MTPAKLCGDCGVQMDLNPDLFALVGIDQTPNGLQFNTGRALPVTTYICPKCGRFKFISAVFLEHIAGLERSQQQTDGQ